MLLPFDNGTSAPLRHTLKGHTVVDEVKRMRAARRRKLRKKK
jgi:hypothetical protein